MEVLAIANRRVLFLDAEGPLLDRSDSANDLIGDAWGHEATAVVVPSSRLDPDFFRLSSGLAGEITQKLVNYRILFVVLGDISVHLEASGALRDYVWESNRGSSVWFLADREEFELKIARH